MCVCGGEDKDGTKLIPCNQNMREGRWERERGRKAEKERMGGKERKKGERVGNTVEVIPYSTQELLLKHPQ